MFDFVKNNGILKLIRILIHSESKQILTSGTKLLSQFGVLFKISGF